MNPIPKWAVFAALALIAVAAGYTVYAMRIRANMDKLATQVLESQAKK